MSSSSSSWHTPKIATEDIAIAKSSRYHHHHHHVGGYDYVEDIDEDGYDFDDHDDPGDCVWYKFDRANVSGQDAEDTIADVDFSDCDVATHSPQLIFSKRTMLMLIVINFVTHSPQMMDGCTLQSEPSLFSKRTFSTHCIDDHIVFSKDSHFHLLSVLICNPV